MNISATPAQGPSRGAIVRSWWHRKGRKAKAIWIGASTFTLMAGIGALLPEESSTASTTDQPTVADAASASESQHTTPETLPPAIDTHDGRSNRGRRADKSGSANHAGSDSQFGSRNPRADRCGSDSG